MAYYITETCIDVKDKACVEVCPVDCIHPIDGEGEPMLYIDPDECIDCGACEPECPVEAIFAEEDMPDDQDRFVEINTKYFELRDDPKNGTSGSRNTRPNSKRPARTPALCAKKPGRPTGFPAFSRLTISDPPRLFFCPNEHCRR